MKPHEPKLPDAELHSPAVPAYDLEPGHERERDPDLGAGAGDPDPDLGFRDYIPPGEASRPDPGIEAGINQRMKPHESKLPPVEEVKSPSQHPFDRISDGFSHGNSFATFNLSGDCDVTIYYPAPGVHAIAVEVITGSAPFAPGAPDTRRRTVLQLPKNRARALASAIMGAAAEL